MRFGSSEPLEPLKKGDIQTRWGFPKPGGYASGQKSSSSTCTTVQGQALGKVVRGKMVSAAAKRRAHPYAEAKSAGTSGRMLG
jgi:hypothetical protein